MEILINIDGVLRNTIAKFDYHYKDHYLDSDPEDLPEDEKGYKYDIIEPIRNNHLMESYKFQSKDEFENAVKASKILFSKSFKEEITTLNEKTFLDIFEGVKQAEISKSEFNEGLDMIGALAAKTDFLNSNGDARRALKENAVAVNKVKVKEDYMLSTEDLINDKYIIISRGKKTNFILKVI